MTNYKLKLKLFKEQNKLEDITIDTNNFRSYDDLQLLS